MLSNVNCGMPALPLPSMSLSEAINRVHALRRAGDLAGALAVCKSLMATQPRNAEAVHLLGLLLNQTGKIDESITWLRKSLALDACQERYWQNLLAVLMGAGRIAEAHEAAREAVGVHSNSGNSWGQLGGVLKAMARVQEAAEAFEKAVERLPNLLPAQRGLADALLELGEAPKAVEHFRAAMKLSPNDCQLHSALLFAMQYCPEISPRQKLAEARAFGRRFDGIAVAAHDNDRSPDRRLRMGYISSDFRQHTIRHVIEPVLEAHDRRQVEVYCYSAVRRPDEGTAALQKLSDHWREITNLNDREAADCIRKDRIDILVDLAGHMGENRLPVLALRPVPVQVQIGYPATTGIDAIDYHIADPYCAPGGVEAQFTEKLLRLPDTGWMYKPCGPYPEVGPLPAKGNGFITFGCLNNPAKICDRSVALWARVLRSISRSKMILLSPLPNDGLYARFSKEGIDSDRLILVPRCNAMEFRNLFNRIDIALDPVTYTGETTTCDGLWMGVPVVSLAGNTMASRRGTTILNNMGINKWIANEPAEYVAIAKSRAFDLDTLEATRAGLRQLMSQSPITDGPRYTRALESAYRDIWQRWCPKS